MSTMDQMTMCNVKGIAHSDGPAENYHRTLQFPSAPCFSDFQLNVLVLQPLFFFFFTVLVQPNHSHKHSFLAQAAFRQKSSCKPVVHHLPSTKTADKVIS